MDKPKSMPVKEYVIRTLSLRMNVPITTIEAVVDFQFNEANEALIDNTSVEISGFGKFILNKTRLNKKYIKNINKREFYENALRDETLSPQKRKSYENKLRNTISWLDSVKSKIEKCQ